MRNVSIRMKYRLKVVDVIIMLTAFGVFSISYLTYVSQPIHMLYYFIQVSIILYGILHTIVYRKYDGMDLLVLLYIAVEGISTVINQGAFREWIMHVKTLLFLYAAFKWVFNWNPHTFAYILSRYSLLLTILNTFSAVISYPKGMFYYDAFSPAFLLGGDNTSTRIYILSILMCFLDGFYNYKESKHNFRVILSLLNFLFYAFLRDIGNGKICALILLLAYLLFEVFDLGIPNKTMKKIVFGNYILFFVIVILQKIEFLSFLIVVILQRNLTITNRTIIWDITIEKIAENAVLGNGYISGAEFESLLPSIIGVNAHNTILMVCFTGGFVLSAIFLQMLYTAAKQYDKAIKQPKMWFVPACYLAMFLRAQVEGGDDAYLIAIAACIVSITKAYLQQSKNLASYDRRTP